MPNLGFLITTSDASWHHFDRVLGEFTRLGYPFAVNFDHCTLQTKKLFWRQPLCVGCYEDDDPKSNFDETHKQRPLDILVEAGFDWAAYLDTDEVFDRRAPEMIPRILASDADLVWCPLLDFWGDDKHYRVDGPLGPCMDPGAIHPSDKQFRDKFYNLRTGKWTYLHADVHSPYFRAKDGSLRAVRRLRSPLYVLHYGLIDRQHTRFKERQWREVYTRKLGKFSYDGFYGYLNNPNTVPEVREFDYQTWDGE